jgi:hypothetical protein
MKHIPALTLATALLFAGCATQPKEQLAAARAAGVSPATIHKLEHWGCLSPADIIELKRRHVNDGVTLRQLDRTGVDYVVDKDILKQFRKAGVSQTVIAAVVLAGKCFEDQYHYHRHYWGGGWYGPWGYPYDPYYYDFGWPYPRGGYGPGFYLGGGPGPVSAGGGGPGGGGTPGGGTLGGGPGGGGHGPH